MNFVHVFYLSLFCFRSIIAKAQNNIPSEMIRYTAAKGTNVSLLCTFSIPPGDSVKLLFWYKSSNATGQPWYIIDARNSSLVNAQHFPYQRTSNRISLDVSNLPPQLKIYDVLEKDDGIHLCRIDFQKARTLIVSIQLQVVVPPKSVLILDEYAQILTGMVGPFDEDSNICLACEAEGGKPPAIGLNWYADGNPIIGTFFTEVGETFVRQRLNLTLSRHFFNKTITCKAINAYFSLSTSIVVDMNLKPTNVTIVKKTHTLFSGQETELICHTCGSRPFADIFWFIGDRKLQEHTQTFTSHKICLNMTRSVLQFIPRPEDDGIKLRCRAQSDAFIDTFLEDSIRLSVLYPPQAHLSLSTKSASNSFVERTSLSMNCHVTANPANITISWLFNGQEIDILHPPSEGVIINGEDLLVKLSRKTAGFFACLAINVQGATKSNEIALTVRYAPICKAAQKIIYGVATGEEVTIACEVDANPANVSFAWQFHGSSTKELSESAFDPNGLKSFLQFSPQSLLDYGTISCSASNSIGHQTEPCLFTILPAGPPDPPLGCRLTNNTVVLFRVHCLAGYDGGLPQTFHLDVYETASDKSLHAFAQQLSPNFTLSNLEPNKTYTLYAYSSNVNGRSSSLVLPVNTTFLASFKESRVKSLFDAELSFGALIAFSTLLLALTIFSATYWRKKQLKTQRNGSSSTRVARVNPDVVPASYLKDSTSEEWLSLVEAYGKS